MTEYIRSIEVTVTIDTNKQTLTRHIELDSLDDVPDAVREAVAQMW